MAIITMKNVSKKYKKATALDSFSLTLEKGHICGLIGPNGAGKTTIIKILAGIIEATEGEIRLFGSDDLDTQRKRTSFMIEEPIVDPMLTVADNLRYIRYLRGYPDEKRIDEVMDIMELTRDSKKRVKTLSLGMKQRLGIAMALLTRPELLVLDEPINGIDPEGIVEIRRIFRRLAEEYSVTLLISSHLLPELAEVCTDFSIMNNGRLIESLSFEELQQKCRSHICLKTTDVNHTAAILEKKLNIRDYRVIHGDEIQIFEQLDRLEKISKTVTDSGLVITKLCEQGQTLEDYYLEMAGVQNG